MFAMARGAVRMGWGMRSQSVSHAIPGLRTRKEISVSFTGTLIRSGGTGAHGLDMLIRFVKPLVFSPFVNQRLPLTCRRRIMRTSRF
jgi:hypothetical protein